MKFLKEIISKRNQYDEDQEEEDMDFSMADDEDQDEDQDEEDMDFSMADDEEDQDEEDMDFSMADDEEDQDEEDMDFSMADDEEDQDEDQEDYQLSQVAIKSTENPDRQGVIRNVPSAHLVYKRQTENGTYDELWLFNSSDTLIDNLKTRKAVLAGTDIPHTSTQSPDGKQQYTIWTAGNGELLNITGLPN
jgi:hypothetical protein